MRARATFIGLVLGLVSLMGRLPAAAAVAAVAAPSPEIKSYTLKLSGTAHGPNVLLRDVVTEELAEPLASVALKPSGRPGGQVGVPLALVQLKFKANTKGPWAVKGPPSCQVSVPIQVIPGAQIQGFAGDFLAAQLSGTAGASIEARGAPQDLSTFDAATRFKIVPGSQDLRGNVVLRVQVMQSGSNGEEREVASVPVSYLVHRKEPRVYSSKVLRKGDALDPSVLTLRDEDSTFAQGQGFSSLEEVSGKRARAYIPAGKAVTADLVELPPLIRRGDIVRLLVKSGGIVIETQGKALRDARKGETLPLELDNNKKQVQARCVDVGVAVREAY